VHQRNYTINTVQREKNKKTYLTRFWLGPFSVSHFILLSSAYEGGWPVLSLAVSYSHRQYRVSIFIVAELARGCIGGAEI